MGSTHPYYRRRRPTPQNEDDYVRDVWLRWILGRLALPPGSLRALLPKFPPSPPGSVRGLVANMLLHNEVCPHVDLENAHLPAYDVSDPVATARARSDQRAAAAVFASVGPHLGVRIAPIIQWKNLTPPPFPGSPKGPRPFPFHVSDVTGQVQPSNSISSFRTLLELKFYDTLAPSVYHPTVKSLAAMAYGDYFPGARADVLRAWTSSAILSASPGWCGTFGPRVNTLLLLAKFPEGNYDMGQQHLLRTAYAYFDELTPDARERLVRQLLARGRIHRVNLKLTYTSGPAPGDFSRAGVVTDVGLHKRLGETENHILMIHTTRYLSNQLMYQRQPDLRYDNRRNGFSGAPTCLDLVLTLLRDILRDDFSEYNAKSYQHETRTALLNLCSFAYDHEVRLAARMVLDYVSAHMAVSSNDCRRMVPFRRRGEKQNVARTAAGHMTVGLTEWQRGCDPMTEHMAMLSGATRAYAVPSEHHRPLEWSIAADGGSSTYEMLSDYRMPAPIHDLFVNDANRRFFQVLTRRDLDDVEVTGRNAVNSEMFASSPSYLITAGGSPAGYAIDPYFFVFVMGDQDQQRGVALPSSFMPTGDSAGNNPAAPEQATIGHEAEAARLIQVGSFANTGPVRNYGVAPDFLCGPYPALPHWCTAAIDPVHRRGKFDFVNKRGPPGRPGFYLALLRDGNMIVIEAYDTWLHPELSFDDFRQHVWDRNPQLGATGLPEFEELTYTTENGNRIRFELWQQQTESDVPSHGAYIVDIEWSGKDPTDRLPDTPVGSFLRGTVLNSSGDGLVEITNPRLGKKITLDMRDGRKPRRVSENNEVEAAGTNQEVWVDFEWAGISPSAGDFFWPFKTLAEGVAAVASHGVINLVPGASAERGVLNGGKRLRLHAPIGGVRIGSRP